MKKKLFAALLLLMAALLIFAGCASGEEIALARSKGVRVTYTRGWKQAAAAPAPLTSEEIFHNYSNTIIRGTIRSVRNLEIDYGGGETAQKALAVIAVTKVLSGNAAAGSTVTVLLPKSVDSASANAASVVTDCFQSGVEGIFLLCGVTGESRAEGNGRIFYYDDICDFFMFGEDHFAVVRSGDSVRFNADLFDGEVSAFATLEEAEAKIRAVLAEE